MSAALLAARLVLASVFLLAAAAKIADREGTRRAVREFRVPDRLALPAASLIPFAELGIAAAFLPGPTARWAAISAMVLLAAFSTAIATALARGEQIDCRCFGELSNAPVTRVSLLRNGVLVALAGLTAVAGPGEGLGGALAGVDVTPVGVAVVLVALALVLQGCFSWQLFRQNGRLVERLWALEVSLDDRDGQSAQPQGLPIGDPAPEIELDRDGRRATLGDLLTGGLPVALVFSDPDCGACAELQPKLERVRDARAGSLEVVLIDRDPDASEAYRIHTVPSATIVDGEGRIASATVTGGQAIEDLILWADAPRMAPDYLLAAV